MFTGIVEEVGVIASPGTRMKVQCRQVLGDAKDGSSIAVNGVCLTVTDLDADGFWCDLSPETLSRSNLGALVEGSKVNLERPAAVGDRLSGHIVQGHVDATAEFISLQSLPDNNWWLKVRIPTELNQYVTHKGSVTLDGVSLTVASLEGGEIGVAIIQHTYENTIIPNYHAGSLLNFEVDVIAKYVEKLLLARL